MNKKMRIFLFVLGILVSIICIVFGAISAQKKSDFVLLFFGLAIFIICVCCTYHYSHMTNDEVKKETEQTINDIKESTVYLHYDNEAIVCPHCSSTSILLKEKKFSYSKAIVGGMMFGYKGTLCGVPSGKKAKCTCAKCGHKFEVVRR